MHNRIVLDIYYYILGPKIEKLIYNETYMRTYMFSIANFKEDPWVTSGYSFYKIQYSVENSFSRLSYVWL